MYNNYSARKLVCHDVVRYCCKTEIDNSRRTSGFSSQLILTVNNNNNNVMYDGKS